MTEMTKSEAEDLVDRLIAAARGVGAGRQDGVSDSKNAWLNVEASLRSELLENILTLKKVRKLLRKMDNETSKETIVLVISDFLNSIEPKPNTGEE